MLKSVILLASAMAFLAGCALLRPPRDPNAPLPPNWDSTQDHPVAPAGLLPAWSPLAPVPPPATPPATPPVTPPVTVETNHFDEETWVGLNHWAAAHGFAPAERLALPPLEMTLTNGFEWENLQLKARTALIPLPTFALHTTSGVLLIQPETRTAHWNGVELHLGFTPGLVQGEPILHTLDLRKNIEPLLCPRPGWPATHCTIVIDPDGDAGSQSLPAASVAAHFALDWAQRLAALLTNNGWTVFLTRTNDVAVSVANRAAFAELHPADLFLNLRFAVAETEDTLAGLETYCLTPVNLPSQAPGDGFEEIWHTFPNNAHDDQNWRYAFRLHRALIQLPGTIDHGLWHSRSIRILRGRTYPAVCLCGGYLSNPHDAALIGDPLFRQKLAAAVAEVLR